MTGSEIEGIPSLPAARAAYGIIGADHGTVQCLPKDAWECISASLPHQPAERPFGIAAGGIDEYAGHLLLRLLGIVDAFA